MFGWRALKASRALSSLAYCSGVLYTPEMCIHGQLENITRHYASSYENVQNGDVLKNSFATDVFLLSKT